MAQWKFDPAHCFIEFSVRHWGVAWVKGRFDTLHGEAVFDESDPEHGSATAQIEATSVWTGNEMRDKHLRSKDFFDVEHHPAVGFKTTRVTRVGADDFSVEGELIIRETTRPVTLAVHYTKPQEIPVYGGGTEVRAGFSAKTVINRHDFGLDWDTPGIGGGASMVGGEVDITVTVEAVKQA